MLINIEKGSYMPSYFYMCINSMDGVEIIERNQPTFVHEYIHFLQDLILPYCIRNNLGRLNEFAYLVNYSKREQKLSRPFKQWDEDQILMRRQLLATWGFSNSRNTAGKISGITSQYFTIPTVQNIYSYKLKIDEIPYQVGARDFLEYIAHKIEDKYWSAAAAPDLPYRTVDRIFEYYGLECIPTEVRICIVEYCLYNDNPVHMLIFMLMQKGGIKNNINTFMDLGSCSEYLLNLAWASRGGFLESIFSKTERRLNDLSDRLNSHYQHPLFDSVQLWINNVIKYCKNNFRGKFIFAELYNHTSQPLFANSLNKIIDDIGIPIIENVNHRFMNLLPKQYKVDQFIQFYILHQFMNYIKSDKSKCPIYDFCVANANCKIDRSLCLHHPLSGLEEEELCPFKAFIKLYGLSNVKFC